MAEVKKAAPPAECQIASIVIANQARAIVRRFLDGASPRTIGRVYGLSRGGVEQLIRVQTRLRARR